MFVTLSSFKASIPGQGRKTEHLWPRFAQRAQSFCKPLYS
jgi:hypothetical protein